MVVILAVKFWVVVPKNLRNTKEFLSAWYVGGRAMRPDSTLDLTASSLSTNEGPQQTQGQQQFQMLVVGFAIDRSTLMKIHRARSISLRPC